MKTAFLKCGAILLGLAASGCATSTGGSGSAAGGVEVGRFHLGEQTIARSQIAIEPFDRADSNRTEFPGYAAAVARELTRLGWTVVPAGTRSEQVALIDVEQGSREAIAALTAARIGRGVSPLPAEGSAANVTATLLEVGIRRRSDGTVFWEGRAVGETRGGAAGAASTATVERLASALFRDFPGQSGRIVRVR
jgi:hypothetical protein